MKKIFVILLLLSSSFVWAQQKVEYNSRAQYEDYIEWTMAENDLSPEEILLYIIPWYQTDGLQFHYVGQALRNWANVSYTIRTYIIYENEQRFVVVETYGSPEYDYYLHSYFTITDKMTDNNNNTKFWLNAPERK